MEKELKKKIPEWIDVKNDEAIRNAGFFRGLPVSELDWSKTEKEKAALKKARYANSSEDGHFYNFGCGYIPVKSKVIIYLKKNKQFPKTTYSVECYQHSLPEVLSKYKEYLKKYYWCGKTYEPNSLPFWG